MMAATWGALWGPLHALQWSVEVWFSAINLRP
jgi:hypothetical protein